MCITIGTAGYFPTDYNGKHL